MRITRLPLAGLFESEILRAGILGVGLLGAGLLGPSLADAKDARVAVRGTPVQIASPAGEGWVRRVETPAAGQWVVSWRTADAKAVVVAMSFPLPPGAQTDVVSLLRRAVDTQFHALGISGYGLPGAVAKRVMGYPAASAQIHATYQGGPAQGPCRLVVANATHAAFAWGLASSGDATLSQAVSACVASMAPDEPAFFDTKFLAPKSLDEELLLVKGEPALTRRHLRAASRLAAAVLGGPIPLARRDRLETAILQAVRDPTERSVREGLRLAPETLARMPGLKAHEQRAKVEALGHAMYRDFLRRQLAGDPLARKVIDAWDANKEPVAQAGQARLVRRQADALLEMGAFLASIVADGARGVSPGEYERLCAWLKSQWPGLSAMQRTTIGEAPEIWLRMRRAWDMAHRGDRHRFRRALLKLAYGQRSAEEIDAARSPVELKAWMSKQRPLGVEAFVQQLARVNAEGWTRLLDALGSPSSPVPVGW